MVDKLPYESEADLDLCKQRCMERDDCGGVSLTGTTCKVMNRACTRDNSENSSTYKLWERKNFVTIGTARWVLLHVCGVPSGVPAPTLFTMYLHYTPNIHKQVQL